MRKLVPCSISLLGPPLLPAAVGEGPADVIGSRFVAREGEDAGDCDDNHEPCRTLLYALTQVDPGDAIKLATGTYDLSGVDIARLAVGEEGVRGGESAEGHFRVQDAESNPTRVTGVR